MTDQQADVVRARPHRLTIVCWALAVAVVVIFSVVAVLLGRPTTTVDPEVGPPFGLGDQIGMVFLGFLLAAGVLSLTRPRVVADAEQIKVRNVVGGVTVPWTLVRGVRFDRHSPWAAIELLDDELVSVLAVQAADKQRALDAVRGLRRLHAAAWEGKDLPS
ncbi:PH domain-containing protein [Cryptosporangium sp. NPDC048952]|uniref:PH domain-containing protein n=1 Tax=Cryptosporangium sp. NPDC048952 TaxID=3363961 RepID=UPI00370FC430